MFYEMTCFVYFLMILSDWGNVYDIVSSKVKSFVNYLLVEVQ